VIDDFLELLIHFVFPYYRKKKRRLEEWKGTVEEKKVRSFSVSKFYGFIIFRALDGRKIRVKVQEEDFHKYELGKMYSKKKGEDLPDPVPD
jgi:hypothetical protein